MASRKTKPRSKRLDKRRPAKQKAGRRLSTRASKSQPKLTKKQLAEKRSKAAIKAAETRKKNKEAQAKIEAEEAEKRSKAAIKAAKTRKKNKEAQAKLEAEETARLEAEAEETARLEAEAEEKARLEAEEKAKIDSSLQEKLEKNRKKGLDTGKILEPIGGWTGTKVKKLKTGETTIRKNKRIKKFITEDTISSLINDMEPTVKDVFIKGYKRVLVTFNFLSFGNAEIGSSPITIFSEPKLGMKFWQSYASTPTKESMNEVLQEISRVLREQLVPYNSIGFIENISVRGFKDES